jgi:putative ABC transport system ATP-binding protein
LNEEQNKTIILITHSPELASETDRIISIRDGNIVDDEYLNGKQIDLNQWKKEGV